MGPWIRPCDGCNALVISRYYRVRFSAGGNAAQWGPPVAASRHAARVGTPINIESKQVGTNNVPILLTKTQ